LEGDRSRVEELAEDLARAEEQYERVRRLLGVADSGRVDDLPLPPLRGERASMAEDPGTPRPSAWPLTQPGVITQRTIATGDGPAHPGLDIAVAADSYIRASGPGTVKDAGVDDVYGRYILIDHGGGIETMYGHASRLFVETGEQVERNEVIALSGSTGRSTAPHLHFEIRRDGQPVDPLLYVRQPS
jgi:murein DD-endopeptidase MepM/ murein hydrolase activator NlpD